MSLEFSDCDEPFVRKLNERGKIIGRDADNRRAALAWDGDKVDFACASGREGPYCRISARSGYMRRHRKTERCTTSQLSSNITEQDVRNRLTCDMQ